VLLALILFFGIFSLWVEAHWALTIFQLAILALAAAQIISRLRSGLRIGTHPIAFLLAGTAAWGLIQVIARQTVYQLRTLETSLDWIVNLAAFSLAFVLARSAKERERFLSLAVIVATVLSLLAIFTILTSPPGKVFWLFPSSAGVVTLGPFVYKNQYAAFVEACLPIAMFYAICARRHRLYYSFAAAALFASVIASGSRGGAALCLGEILIVPMILFTQNRFSSVSFAGLLLGSVSLAAVMAAIVGWQTLWVRLQEPHPYALRRDLTESSLEMVRDRPWTGFGLGTWSAAYPGYARFDDGLFVNQAHNDWMQWAAEGGIPFFILTLATALWIIRPALRSVWGVGILAVFLHAAVDYPFQQRPALAAFVFALTGVLAGEQGARAHPVRKQTPEL
jgi:O-antigen ligase